MASSTTSSAEAAAREPTQRALPLAARTTIVTGASHGIRHAIAAHLASLGADVLLSYSSSSAQAELLVTELNSSLPTTNPGTDLEGRARVSARRRPAVDPVP
uniref:Uncharacterized protein n=1 Tax=Ananas comosus var. bracteatus TaxID=296719 RepID=A0A6V7P1G3_ANACO|nr:unnamed protein product [Ananas comosus var. bracteatus]